MKQIISKVNHDIHARSPINKQSALHISESKGYVPDRKFGSISTDGFIPIAPPKDHGQHQILKKVIHKKFGLFTVIGIAPKEISANHKCMFVVRCTCGQHETRSSRAILNPNNQWDRCGKCRHILELRRMEYYRNTGKEQPWEYFA